MRFSFEELCFQRQFMYTFIPVVIWAKSRKYHLLSGAPLAGLLPVVM